MIRSSREVFVSVLMPIRNERDHVAASLEAVLDQDYPRGALEVIVIDGMSDDGTGEQVQRVVEAREPRIPTVRLIENPKRIAAAALNLGIEVARGGVVVRVDGHSIIPRHYVRECVRLIQERGFDCVGGRFAHVGGGLRGRAIACAQSSVFGVGTVAFRQARGDARRVDTVPCPAYPRDVFDRIGLFDEELLRDQDDEFNFRLSQSGGTVWLDPSLTIEYFGRDRLLSLARQYFEYGVYKVLVIRKRRGVAAGRHVVPGVFVLVLGLSIAASLVTGKALWAGTVALPYLVAALAASLGEIKRARAAALLLPLAFAVLHVSYGAGFLWGAYRWRAGWGTSLRRVWSGRSA